METSEAQRNMKLTMQLSGRSTSQAEDAANAKGWKMPDKNQEKQEGQCG